MGASNSRRRKSSPGKQPEREQQEAPNDDHQQHPQSSSRKDRRERLSSNTPNDDHQQHPQSSSRKDRRERLSSNNAPRLTDAVKVTYNGSTEVYQIPKSQVIEERAARLGIQYGLSTKPWDWEMVDPEEMVLRTDKDIRMRVRYQCHRCDTPLPSSKQCKKCHHTRCTKCPRDPPKDTDEAATHRRTRKSEAQITPHFVPPIIVDYRWDDPGYVLKRPSKTGGQDLIHKDSRQRVRRTCHECETIFAAGANFCDKCGHRRCTDCPREPAKKHKYPFGYPGDEFGPSSVPYYECRRCETLYPFDSEHGTPCSKCGTEKADDSPRALPRAVEPTPDPALLQAIQAKLDALP